MNSAGCGDGCFSVAKRGEVRVCLVYRRIAMMEALGFKNLENEYLFSGLVCA